MSKFYIILFFFTISLFGNIKFGYVSGGTNEFIMTKYKGEILSEYFKKKLDENIIGVNYSDYNSLYSAIKSKSIEFAVIANYNYRKFIKITTPIVNTSKTGRNLSNYIIIVNKKLGVNDISDFKNRTLVYNGKLGALSYISSIIKKNPEDVFSKILIEKSSIKLISKIISKQIDIACVKEGSYNSILKYRPNYKSILKVISHSKKYASDLIIASKKISTIKINKIKKIFLEMNSDPQGGQVLVSLKLTKFIKPIVNEKSYPTLILYKKLKIKPKNEVLVKEEIRTFKKTYSHHKNHNFSSKKKKEIKNLISKHNDINRNIVNNVSNTSGENTKNINETLKEKNISKFEKIKEENQKLRKELNDKKHKIKTKIVEVVKINKNNNESIILYVILGLFLITTIIIIIIVKRMKTQNKVIKIEDDCQNKLINDFYGDTNSKVGFDIDMPEFTSSTVISTIIRVALSGSLEGINVSKIFKKLMDDEKTGILTLSMEGVVTQVIDIKFNQGKITTAFCKTGSFQTKLKNNIIKELPNYKNKIEVIFNDSIENQEKFCSMLRNENIIEGEKLNSLILVQAKEIILSIFLWKKGYYEFKEVVEDDLDFEEKVNNELQFDVTSLIQEGITRHKEWKYISKNISKATNKVLFLENKKDELISNKSNKNLLEVINFIDDNKTIKEICSLSRFSDFKILKLLARLKEKGYIKFE